MWGCYSRTHLLPSQWPLKPCWTKISWISPPFIAKPCGNLKKRDTKMAKKVNEIILLFFLLILDNHHLHHRIPKLHPDFSSPSTVMIIWTWNRNATIFKIMAMLLLIVVTIISIDTKWCCFNQEENTYSWSHTEQRRKASWKVKITFNEDSSPSQSSTWWSTIKAIFYRQISSFCLCTSIIIIVTIMIKMISIMIMTHRQAQIYCQRRQPPDQEPGN